MRDLNYQLKGLCHSHREGSFGTQKRRHQILQQIANELHGLGFRKMQARSLKPKHVDALVAKWQADGLSVGTVKNRMAILRWWAEKTDKRGVIAASNAHYGIPDRIFVATESRARALDATALMRISDPHVRLSLELQQAFGLRREEAIKCMPAYADRGDRLLLKASWTKGGRAREIPIVTDTQREILDRAHALAGKGSLIPATRSYVQQLRCYEGQTLKAGLARLHGLRHAYAQARYRALTGWPCPVAGGPPASHLSPDERALDRAARLILSHELGHGREQITTVYLGR